MSQSSFITLKKNKIRIMMREGYQKELLKLGVEDPERMIRGNKVQLIKDGSRSLIVSLPLGKGRDSERVVLKYYKYRGLFKGLVDMFRVSKAMRAWKVGNRLLEMGIRTPVPLAIGERRTLRWLRKSFLITKEISNFTLLDRYLSFFDPPLSKSRIKEKRAFIISLAKNIRKSTIKA